jgi:hypothetical protein
MQGLGAVSLGLSEAQNRIFCISIRVEVYFQMQMPGLACISAVYSLTEA